jgi:hypothetical protein
VRIYVEGGGDSNRTRRVVRKDLGDFFRHAGGPGRTPAVIPSGGRDQTRKAFENAIDDHPDAFVILLVDAEGPVSANTRRAHLHQRDGWPLAGVREEQVHLMVQTFEAWVVADENAIAEFYGQGFNKKALPQNQNLEAVSVDDLKASLKKATRRTKIGTCDKIKHGPSILAKANAMTVRGKCSSCEKLFAVLAGV